MDMLFGEPAKGLVAALAVGLLIGLERGWRQRGEAPGGRVAGFRTFGLIGLGGGIAALVPVVVGGLIAGVVAAALVVGYGRRAWCCRSRSSPTPRSRG